MKRNNDYFTDDFDGKSRQSARRSGRPRKKNYKLRRIILFAVIDLLLIGIGLIVFALFHHAIPKKSSDIAVALPTPEKTQAVVVETTPDPQTTPDQTDGSVQTTPSPTPLVDQGMWGEKFADKFTDGEVIQTENSYQSEDINVTITTVQENSATYYVADIYVRNIENFRTMFAQDTYGKGITEKAVDMAARTGAIVAISGDNYSGTGREFGVVIRNGELYREVEFEDVLIMNNDGSMQTFSPEGFDIEAVKQNGAWQGWAFGPMLLDNGQPMETFNSRVNPRNPRSAIGYYEPGHYCFVVVDGRQPGHSDGLTTQQMSQLFYDLGCTVAYNLDGGQTAVMVYNDEEYSIPYEGGRATSDILYIAENEG